jgi:hypothetical protein
MKNKRFLGGILGFALVFALITGGCPNPTDGTTEGSGTPETSEVPETPETPNPVDPAFWFKEIHDELIIRIGEVSSDGYPDITDPNGVDVGQIVNTQYVCNAINAKWGTSYTPVSGTASQAANCEYLLKLIDKANRNTTSYGTGSYATKQVLDKTAVDTAVQKLWVPGSKFVVVASDNKAAYSTDGINWTAATLPNASWGDVTYGNDKFVAVVINGDKAAYSTDGINWTAATFPSNTDVWSNVTYGNGKFVAVASSNKAAYSTDGINWTVATLPSIASWSSVTYGNGRFVAVAIGSDKTAYSTDGINWTTATLPSVASWYDVAYGNGKFVTVAFNGDKAAYSTDGINWTAATLPNSAGWNGVTYGGE